MSSGDSSVCPAAVTFLLHSILSLSLSFFILTYSFVFQGPLYSLSLLSHDNSRILSVVSQWPKTDTNTHRALKGNDDIILMEREREREEAAMRHMSLYSCFSSLGLENEMKQRLTVFDCIAQITYYYVYTTQVE